MWNSMVVLLTIYISPKDLRVVKAVSAVSDDQIWSSDAEQTHSPPSNLVMKEQTWHLADDMKTTLLDSKGEVLILTLLHSLGFLCSFGL